MGKTLTNVDWGRIRALWKQGASPEEISHDLGGKPTPRGIKIVSTRERWLRSGAELAAKLKATPGTRAAAIDCLRNGGTYSMAAAMAGVDRATLTAWRKDPAFQLDCDMAVADFAASQVYRVNQAGHSDWKAASFLLTHHPETRKEFAPAVTNAGAGIHITLNIPRDSETLPAIEGDYTEGQLLEG